MFTLIHLIVSFFKERKIIKQINRINRKLKTNLSYYYFLEEIDFLKSIDREIEGTTYKRSEHLANVCSLIKKGLKEEYLSKYKSNKAKYISIIDIELMYKELCVRLVDYLIHSKILAYDLLKRVSRDTCYIDKNSIYFKSFSKYDLADLDNLSNIVLNGLDTLKQIRINYKDNIDSYKVNEVINKKNVYKYLNGFNKSKYGETKNSLENLIYFGPSTYYLNNERRINNYKHQKIWFYKESSKLRINLLNNDINLYRETMLNSEENRLNNYFNVIKNNEFNDYYFDYFIYRLLNDINYLNVKNNGGIKRTLDEPINGKRKAIKKGGKVKQIEILQSEVELENIVDKENNKETIVLEEENKAHKLFKEKVIIEELNKEELIKNKRY